MSRYFHFTLGPVQGFVAQARRTRDFWAGSFILSWLSAVAMREAMAQNSGNEIIFPVADKDYLKWLDGAKTGKDGPRQGSVPNRFVAIVEGQFDPEYIRQAVLDAWRNLAERIWIGDLKRYADDATKDIWRRQIQGFWEINWAFSSSREDSSVLDRRKNWRSYLPPEEPGVKCMMMDGWQELSGAEHPGDPRLGDFWRDVRNSTTTGIATDLREKEYLCAIGYIKRRFSRYFHGVNIKMPGGWMACGWGVPDGVPSVSYMAASRWLAHVIDKAGTDSSVSDALIAFHDAVVVLTKGSYPEFGSNLTCVKDALKNYGQNANWRWAALDGSVFFESVLESKNIYPDPALESQKEEVIKKLRALRGSANIGPVSPFYAVLLMDGDALGQHLGDTGKQDEITTGLANFTGEVPKIVKKYNGFLIYAGGDDVLAALPLEDALNCAVALREYYMCCFSSVPTTLSGAIEFAHIRMPLTRVLRDAHDLLDNVAKDGRGRDAIAVRVWKPGGQALEWSMPWEVAIDDGVVVLQRLAEAFARDEASAPFTNSFFYRIRERFDLLNPALGGTKVLDGVQAISLMAAEYLSSGVNQGQVEADRVTLTEAKATVEELLAQCRPWTRKVRADGSTLPRGQWKESDHVYADGALLLRFLAQKEVER